MPDKLIDPSRLEGDALARWYRRSPQEIEQEREDHAEQLYQAFFRPAGDARANEELQPLVWQEDAGSSAGILDKRGAGPVDASLFIEIGNPENRKMIKQHEREKGPWPRTEDGRPYDVSHKRAIADGGTNTLDNIEPMHPEKHRAKHLDDQDAARWGKRSAIARTFGGRVEPPVNAPRPRGGSTIRGLGLLGLIPTITGLLSGRIRRDTPMHTLYDILGVPSEDDLPRADRWI